jgi:hypothetical protein
MENYVLWKSIPTSIVGKLVKLSAGLLPLSIGIMAVIGILSTLPTSDDPAFAIVAAGLCAAMFCGIGVIILTFCFSNLSRSIGLTSLDRKGLVCEEYEGRNGDLFISLVLVAISIFIVIMGLMKGIPIAVVSIIFWIPGLFFLYSYFSLRKNLKEISATEVLLTSGVPTLGRVVTGRLIMGCECVGNITMTLYCKKGYWKSSREGSSTKTEEIMHKQSVRVSVDQNAGINSSQRRIIEFSTDLPCNRPESQASKEGVILWTLHAKGKAKITKNKEGEIKEKSFSRTWIIPVVTLDKNSDVLSEQLEGELI